MSPLDFMFSPFARSLSHSYGLSNLSLTLIIKLISGLVFPREWKQYGLCDLQLSMGQAWTIPSCWETRLPVHTPCLRKQTLPFLLDKELRASIEYHVLCEVGTRISWVHCVTWEGHLGPSPCQRLTLPLPNYRMVVYFS